MKQLRFAGLVCVVLIASVNVSHAQKGVWTDPKDESLPADFKIQGEYTGDKIGAQVIALGSGNFQAVIYPGGLPGGGWDGKHRSLMAGKLDGDGAKFSAADGKRRYLGKSGDEFSATSQFPPQGHVAYVGSVKDGQLTITGKDGKTIALKRNERASKTIGAKPPEGAVILFDGSTKDAWTGGRVDELTNLLNTDGKDILTKRTFNNYTVHLEFMLPYRPDARGQGRGNSGFYQVDHYEVQILDSFGLEGKNNECGGVYQKADSLVNGCLPPLQWQTYDMEFTNSVVEDGKKVKNAVLTARLNGLLIHDKLEINGKTGGSRSAAEGTPGPLKLQGHGNPLQFRNIWIVEK